MTQGEGGGDGKGRRKGTGVKTLSRVHETDIKEFTAYSVMILVVWVAMVVGGDADRDSTCVHDKEAMVKTRTDLRHRRTSTG